jgi:DNA-binding transcriptional LysR family regulator
MEMSHVRYFLALCRERNFTRAARRCGVAQPSLTRAIKVLERELGGLLFQRLPAGAELTTLGAALEPHFAAIRLHADKIRGLTKRASPLDRKLPKAVAAERVSLR